MRRWTVQGTWNWACGGDSFWAHGLGVGLQLDEVKEEIHMTLVQVQYKVTGRAIGFDSGKNLEGGKLITVMCTNVHM